MLENCARIYCSIMQMTASLNGVDSIADQFYSENKNIFTTC